MARLRWMVVLLAVAPALTGGSSCEVRSGPPAGAPPPGAHHPSAGQPSNLNPAPALPQALWRVDRSLYFERSIQNIHDANVKVLQQSMFKVRQTSTNGEDGWWTRAEGWRMMVHVELTMKERRKYRVSVTYICNTITKNKKEADDLQRAMNDMADKHLDAIGKELGKPGTTR